MTGHREIAAHLRARIDDGELRPGDRLPSTRALVREWGVAMATASRAIAELDRLGLAVPVVGRGTVVADPTRRRTAEQPRARVSRPVLVATAVAIADREGLEAVTIRRLAQELGQSPMAMYHHVRDKDELVELMLSTAWADLRLPAHRPDWREDLTRCHRALWRIFQAHPWLAPAMSITRPQLIDTALPFAERCLVALRTAGFGPEDGFVAYLGLFAFTRGLALGLEAERAARADTGETVAEWVAREGPRARGRIDAERHPAFAEVLGSGYDHDLDRVHLAGLRAQLAGLAPQGESAARR